jgi:hypothetical protein
MKRSETSTSGLLQLTLPLCIVYLMYFECYNVISWRFPASRYLVSVYVPVLVKWPDDDVHTRSKPVARQKIARTVLCVIGNIDTYCELVFLCYRARYNNLFEYVLMEVQEHKKLS